MKRLCLAVAALAALIAAGCSGGGGSIPTPPPPVGGFSNASLNGQYAFSMAGNDVNGFFFARIGSFTADGQGHITTGLEDVNTTSTVPGFGLPLQFANSTYTIQADGRGIVLLTNATRTLQFSVTLISTTKGYIVETDGSGTASGTFTKQDPSAFTSAGLSGSYVFDFSGVDITNVNNVVPLSIVGQFTSNGGGVIPTGVLDVNDGATPSGVQTFLNGSYQLDTNGNGTNFGRGTATFDGLTYAFYIVDGTHAKFLEEDTSGATVGDAMAQTQGMERMRLL